MTIIDDALLINLLAGWLAGYGRPFVVRAWCEPRALDWHVKLNPKKKNCHCQD